MTVCCVVLDVGDEDMMDGRDRRTIVREITQLRRDKDELVEKNRSLMKEKKQLEGDRLLRIWI